MSQRPRVAVLASGTGRSLENLAQLVVRGELEAALALVVTDRPAAGALERAERFGIEALVVRWSRDGGSADFSQRVFAELERRSIEFVVLAGFLRLLRLPEAWLGRVINIHPSLLPAFGGKGYYGDRVHAAVLEAGVDRSGCTVHFVDNQYDHGPVILQREVAVRTDDTVASLGARVFAQEREALPEALRRLLAGELSF